MKETTDNIAMAVGYTFMFSFTVICIVGGIFWFGDKIAFRKHRAKRHKELMDYAKEKPVVEKENLNTYETTFLKRANLLVSEYQRN